MSKTNADTRLLNEIYYSAINAITVLSSVLDKLGAGDFFDILFEQMTGYREIANSAITLLGDNGERIMPQSVGDRFGLHTAKRMTKILQNQHRTCGIIIRGSVEGIKDIAECINVCTDARKETRLLAYRLIEAEEENIRACRLYITASE